MSFKLYLVRHAQSEDNVCSTTSTAHTKLTSLGILQANRLAKYLLSVPVDVLISSPWERARHTTEIITKENPSLKIEFDNLVTERNMGIFSGKSRKEFSQAASNANKKIGYFRPEGGENMDDVLSRAQDFFSQLKQRVNEDGLKSVLVVSHNGFISALICHLFNRPWNDALLFKVQNTSISWFEFDADFKIIDFEVSSMKHIFMGV